MVGCGGETEDELTGEPTDKPPTPGAGPDVPGEEGTEEGGTEDNERLTTRFKNHTTARFSGRFFCAPN